MRQSTGAMCSLKHVTSLNKSCDMVELM
jgi:hypothetical protein